MDRQTHAHTNWHAKLIIMPIPLLQPASVTIRMQPETILNFYNMHTHTHTVHTGWFDSHFPHKSG